MGLEKSGCELARGQVDRTPFGRCFGNVMGKETMDILQQGFGKYSPSRDVENNNISNQQFVFERFYNSTTLDVF